MASAELYRGGQEKSFKEKALWYTTALGLVAITAGLLGNINNLAVLGLVMTAGGLILQNEGKK